MVVSQLVFAGCMLAIFAAHDIVTVGALLCVCGMCHAAGSVNLYAIAQMFAGRRASGTWVGVQNSVGNISGIIGPIVSGIIIDRAGYGGAFGLSAAVAATGALLWVVAVPRIEQIELD